MTLVHAQSANSAQATTASIPLLGRKVLVGASGSVAAVRVPRLITQLRNLGADVRLIVTDGGKHFVSAEEPIPNNVTTYRDEDEWSAWSRLSDPVLHIVLRKWADILVIAPTSANTLAKLANGLCDNLLTCVARAWPLKCTDAKPLLVAPAMNTYMWQHPITTTHLASLAAFGITIIPPVSKTLACGDEGLGAMEEIPNIVRHVLDTLTQGTTNSTPQ